MSFGKTPSLQEVKGLEMAKAIGRRNEPDVAIQRLNKLTYKVKSQSSSEKWYTVIKQHSKTFGDNIREGKWTCDCPDYQFKAGVVADGKCKHIHAVLFSKLLRKKVYQDTLLQTPISQSIINNAKEVGQIACQRCESSKYVKCSVRHNKKAGDIQRYLCKDCGYRFIVNPGFENAKASAKTITEAVDLYFKGVSLRKIEDHFRQSSKIEVSYGSVGRWIRKFNRIVQPYVDSFVPSEVGGVYHVDEMLLHVRKEKNEMNMTLDNKENHTHRFFNNHYSWLWNLMDSTTRFWICSRISQKRDGEAGRALMKEMKARAPLPKAIVHDGLRAYDEMMKTEMFTKRGKYNRLAGGLPQIEDVRSVGSGHKGLNPKVERLNGTVRDRESVMRGLDTARAAQELLDAMRNHYNFIRPNQAIGGQTPAEAAGINLNLGENKTENIMRQAAIHRKEARTKPLVKGLGIRVNKIQILNEKDCIKVQPISWLDKKDWIEINDILRVQGLNWLSNGKDSCWIRMNPSTQDDFAPAP